MHQKSQFVSLILIVFLFIGSTSKTFETHIITLNVNTSQVNGNNINEVCDFGQGEGISNVDFTITVKPGDVIMWQGVSSNAPDTDEVLIQSINHEGGARVFSKNILKDSNQNPGVVVGTVSEGKDGDEQKYKISFKVLNNGVQRGGTFHIDPKIKVKS